MDKTHKQVGRLAMRQEGAYWNAYYAMPDTMDGAILLGSLRMKFATNQDRHHTFMNLMRECVADVIEEEFGVRPEWGGPRDAPESERAGSA